jgi:hypothetical protein
VSHETDLRTAIAFLADLEAELEERSAVRAPAHRAAREDMYLQLGHARELVRSLEQKAYGLSCLSCHSGCETVIDLQRARSWCSTIEAKIERVCFGATVVAAA